MDSDRHFRTTSNSTASSELFICFTSRLSSSSAMKISSKSILSPGRAREPSQISLSTSLSRRLKTSGSLKGGQASPMFPTGAKKRGCAFDNPEPSSPKVTCIGQVRVKTKKQGKKMRARSQKRRSNSEASFRKSEQVQPQTNGGDQQFVAKQSHHHLHLHRQNSNSSGGNGFQIQNSQQQECLSHRNQRWVHLPFTICEALRAFGAELNCFLPCHSSCTSDRDKESKPAAKSSESESSCGTVFARWLVAVQDGDGQGREIELVVGDEETRMEKDNGSQRRHVFEGVDFKDKSEVVEEEEEESRISICIPPKNALLLMRCRSDPVKVAELAKRFCESPAPKVEEEEDEEDEQKDKEEKSRQKEAAKMDAPLTVILSNDEDEEETKVELNVKLKNDEEMSEESVSDGEEENYLVLQQEEEHNEEETLEIATDNEIDVQKLDITVNHHNQEEPAEDEQEEEEEHENNNNDEDNQPEELAEETRAIPSHCDPELAQDAEKVESAEEEDESKFLHGNESINEIEDDEEQTEEEGENGGNPASPSLSVETERAAEDMEETEADVNWEEEEEEEEETIHWEDREKATEEEGMRPDIGDGGAMEESKERETPAAEAKREAETGVLPDCLLLMMYEPKLSMEVSKETWVCSTDFIRCVPTREKKAAAAKKREAKTA
ncbi:uncharacterized protein LOC111012918, partial [Momordica charantia]|uniref:Uncharacterized protein LOC111012918 n=1 Tax=Momordica charantia TaxID=3673 RepID=A0A6J1CNN3_MOMCH